jgi:RNA polymerase sigma factor (sigma-70 family)
MLGSPNANQLWRVVYSLAAHCGGAHDAIACLRHRMIILSLGRCVTEPAWSKPAPSNSADASGVHPASTVHLMPMSESFTAFNTAIAPLLPRMRRFARALAHNREQADNLVQLAIERALIRSVQWEQGTRLDSWIFRIMNNAWVDDARSRIRNRPEQSGAQGGAGSVEPAGSAGSADSRQLARAIGMLDQEQRVVLALVLVDGLPYRDAAGVLDIPVGTLTGRLASARAALRARLPDQAGNKP